MTQTGFWDNRRVIHVNGCPDVIKYWIFIELYFRVVTYVTSGEGLSEDFSKPVLPHENILKLISFYKIYQRNT